MNKTKQVCNKRKHNRKQVTSFLNRLKKGGYGKTPWRNEVSYYKCDICNSYHTSSILENESKTLLKGKTYFEHQKEKWSSFLLNYSGERGRI